MISVIYSTREDNQKHLQHIKDTCGVHKMEVIQYINNGEYSLTELYNKALQETTNNIVVFCHDDIIFETKNWGKRLLKNFKENEEYGIIGIAGTTDIDETGRWWNDNTKMVGVVKHRHNGKTWENKYSSIFNKQVLQTVIVDGLFFAVNKDKIKENFDEDVKGFHFYEIDFCFRNHLKGVKIGVTFDVRVIHKSIGETNDEWEKNRVIFSEKFKEELPCNLKPNIIINNNKIKLSNTPKLGVIIPTKGNVNLLTNCIDSFWENDSYDNLVVYIADTGSSEEEKKEILDFIQKHKNYNRDIRLIEYDYYNFSKINNDVVNNHLDSDNELILFCNNDIKLINNAITQLVNVYLKNKKSVGTIGGRLHFGDNTIQHSGVVSYLMRNNNNQKYHIGITHFGIRSYYSYYKENREVLGNTAAFLLISKNLFNSVGGFNENYLECFEDVQLNIDCLNKGKKNIFVSNAVCYHYESQTRNKDQNKLNRESQDYSQRIIPYIIKNKKTYKYFTNVKEDVLKMIFK